MISIREILWCILGALLFILIGEETFSQTPSPSPSSSPAAFNGDAIIATAMKELGIYKVPHRDCFRVAEYCTSTGNSIDLCNDDEWCSAFAAWALKENGYKYPTSNYEISWDMETNKTDTPVPGDLVLLKGHIAFFLNRKRLSTGESVIEMLGGNQDYRVSLMTISELLVHEYREPVPRDVGVVKSDTPATAFGNVLDDRGWND